MPRERTEPDVVLRDLPTTVRPEHVAAAYSPALRWFLGATACYYAIIATSHIFDEVGPTRVILFLMASAGCLGPLAAWIYLKRAPTQTLGRLEAIAGGAYCLFISNVVVHELLDFRPERLVYFAFMAMVFGATAPTLRAGYAAIAAAIGAMVLLGQRMGSDFFDIYAYVCVAGAFAAVGMTTILRGVVMREIRARILSEGLLIEARSAARAKSAFLATISHEIRTPLNGVLGMAQAMRQETLSERQAGRLRVLHHEAETLRGILDDILDIASIEANDLELRPQAFDLPAFAQGLERLYSAAAAAKSLELAIDVRDHASGPCVADERRLRQVAAGLISNAIKFTPAGTVTVSFEAREDELVLRVADTGVGIPAAAQRRIFEPFTQIDDSITRDAGGAGLGLAICRRLVELMGGSLSLDSKPGAGTQITVRTPIRRGAIDESTAKERASHLEAVGRALIVDDNPTNRLVLRTLLESLGLDCDLAGSGREAVKACEDGAWDVILMDIHMPEMDGMAATRAIRKLEARERHPRTPIIAVTASVLPEDVVRYDAAGMDAVVSKPITLDALAEVVVRVLSTDIPAGSEAIGGQQIVAA